jgi:hypothetical protein
MNEVTLWPVYEADETRRMGQASDDRVMGGVSVARVARELREGEVCDCLSGAVSLAQRGGFVQMKWPLERGLNAGDAQGMYLEVWGNGQAYNLHLRTRQLWLPWQSYRASFIAQPTWQRIFLPFDQFEGHKTQSRLNVSGITKVAVLAIGREFDAEICVKTWGLYRDETV